MICQAIIPSSTEACRKPADYVVVFGDGQKATCCQACAVQLEQIALSHGTRIKTERLK